ncbi:vegetative cell wall protein gp1-like [Theropithecus gelada]|uniref:vegetative cell wall protein gp1-like n=1 Tax=Theropithecus gelada TaxID=9565 RepID=UPI000DC1A7BB|nr:vegetative cell wall protein gp1-like [Theropithecus gelada]
MVPGGRRRGQAAAATLGSRARRRTSPPSSPLAGSFPARPWVPPHSPAPAHGNNPSAQLPQQPRRSPSPPSPPGTAPRRPAAHARPGTGALFRPPAPPQNSAKSTLPDRAASVSPAGLEIFKRRNTGFALLRVSIPWHSACAPQPGPGLPSPLRLMHLKLSFGRRGHPFSQSQNVLV